MRLTTTVPDYLALATIDDDVRRAAAWTEHYEAAHPDVFATYHRGWGRHDRCLAAAADVPRQAATLPVVEARARRLAQHAERSFRTAGLLDDDLDVVLMVGGHTSDGWVTPFAGRDTIFLALEYLGDPPYDGVLVSHEAFHVAHARHGASGWPEDGAAGLFQEGLAVAVSRALHPGLPDSGYLWMDDAHAAWVEECTDLAPVLAARMLGLLDTPYDDEAVRSFFTGDRRQPDLPVRAGYWLGDVVARSLLEETPTHELIEWDHPTVRLAVADRLGAMV
jgi:hypothetical protein